MESRTEHKQRALTFAVLLFAQSFFSTTISPLSAWYSRRCFQRTRAELMMQIYDKLMSRKVIVGFETTKPAKVVGIPPGRTENTGTQTANGNAHNQNPIATASNANKKASSTPGILKLFKQLIWFTKEPKTKADGRASHGQILNLLRSDAAEVATRFLKIDTLFTTPLGIIFSTWILWRFLGWTTFVLVVAILISEVFNGMLGALQVRWGRLRRKASDERVQMNSQFIEAIRHLRWYGWEQTWLTKVMASRRHELNVRLVNTFLLLVSYILAVASWAFLPVITFFAYTAIAGQELSIDLIFPALHLIGSLKGWLGAIPTLVTTLLNAYVAMGRIESFLKEPEKKEMSLPAENDPTSENRVPLKLYDCSFAWPGKTKAILTDVNLVIGPGLTMVHGQIGVGKTALLQALLGEMEMLSGQSEIPNEAIAYCSQTPWLQSVSIRDNILFFGPYDEERYNMVLDCCALLPDLATFKDGDRSHIGEK
jgi:ABC-type multidrug transport system fused ATPase/permease subunit